MQDRVLQVMAEQCTGRGVRGVVAAAAPMAAAAGADALRQGGNAFDAAVAAALAETVLLPPKCGFGGDLVAVAVGAGEDEPAALVAVGGAASGLAEVARVGRWSDVGPTSVGVPSAAAGYAALAGRGRLSREVLAARAVELAEGGFPWAPVCAELGQAARELVATWQPDGCVYQPGGEPLGAGVRVRLPGLARVLHAWVGDPASVLEGDIGAAIVERVRSAGGALDHDDLRGVSAAWEPCASAEVDGHRLWVTPAPTHGPSLLDACRAATEPGATYHRVLAAIARRRDALADPSGTSMVSAADSEGNVVVVVHSNSYPRFGSGLVVEEYDLVLGNRAGRGFTPEPGHPNFPDAGRRPATTLHAWAVGDESGPRWLGGTPGGENQMPWNAQVLGRLLAGERHLGRLVAAPQWEWLPADDGVRVETGDGAADERLDALRAVAPRVVSTTRWGLKSAIQVVQRCRPDDEVCVAAADPRTVGLALGV